MKRACTFPFLALALLLAGSPLLADLARVNAEPNLEKRSKLALENAEAVLKDARAAYDKGDAVDTRKLLGEVKDSVLLAQTSLKETGKDPRRSPKWFKYAEIHTRDLLRRLDAFREQMSYTDRPMIEAVRPAIQQVHDDILMGIMEGRRK